jgi:alpha-L-fucosidase 2
MRRTRFAAVVCSLSLGILSLEAAGEPGSNERIWFQYPGQEFNSQALHLGNGYFGASFYGGVKEERFQLAEKTFWTGGPAEDSSNSYGIIPGGKDYVQELRRLITTGNIKEADDLAAKHFMGDYSKFGAFSTVGELSIAFDGHAEDPQDYVRELDLSQSLARVSYTMGSVKYTREYFCSYPARVLAVRLTSGTPGKVGFVLGLKPAHKEYALQFSPDSRTCEIVGKIDGNGRRYCVRIELRPEGGQLTHDEKSLRLEGGDAATIFYTIATEYVLQPPSYRGADPVAITKDIHSKLADRSYDDIRAEHIRDYQNLYQRTSFELPGLPDAERLATNDRWRKYADGDYSDLGLKVLAFNLGKYLLISASRPGSLPANLQGVWNPHYTAPWSGNYQININIQMIYMSGGALDLPECQEPLIDWVRALVVPGREVAKAYYGTPGWITHTTGNIWGYASPGASVEWGLFPCGAAWLCRHLWEQYEFTQNTQYLREKTYPVMKEAAEFWLANLVEYKGYLTSAPAVSAEHASVLGHLTPGPYQDNAMIGDLLDNVVAASKVLNTDDDFRAKVEQARSRLMPMRIGRFGQLQEWADDLDKPEDHHRHFMHIYARCIPGRCSIRSSSRSWPPRPARPWTCAATATWPCRMSRISAATGRAAGKSGSSPACLTAIAPTRSSRSSSARPVSRTS